MSSSLFTRRTSLYGKTGPTPSLVRSSCCSGLAEAATQGRVPGRDVPLPARGWTAISLGDNRVGLDGAEWIVEKLRAGEYE
jgi:hypothetical protein